MTDFLYRLVDRTLGTAPAARPLIGAIFGPGPVAAAVPTDSDTVADRTNVEGSSRTASAAADRSGVSRGGGRIDSPPMPARGIDSGIAPVRDRQALDSEGSSMAAEDTESDFEPLSQDAAPRSNSIATTVRSNDREAARINNVSSTDSNEVSHDLTTVTGPQAMAHDSVTEAVFSTGEPKRRPGAPVPEREALPNEGPTGDFEEVLRSSEPSSRELNAAPYEWEDAPENEERSLNEGRISLTPRARSEPGRVDAGRTGAAPALIPIDKDADDNETSLSPVTRSPAPSAGADSTILIPASISTGESIEGETGLRDVGRPVDADSTIPIPAAISAGETSELEPRAIAAERPVDGESTIPISTAISPGESAAALRRRTIAREAVQFDPTIPAPATLESEPGATAGRRPREADSTTRTPTPGSAGEFEETEPRTRSAGRPAAADSIIPMAPANATGESIDKEPGARSSARPADADSTIPISTTLSRGESAENWTGTRGGGRPVDPDSTVQVSPVVPVRETNRDRWTANPYPPVSAFGRQTGGSGANDQMVGPVFSAVDAMHDQAKLRDAPKRSLQGDEISDEHQAVTIQREAKTSNRAARTTHAIVPAPLMRELANTPRTAIADTIPTPQTEVHHKSMESPAAPIPKPASHGAQQPDPQRKPQRSQQSIQTLSQSSSRTAEGDTFDTSKARKAIAALPSVGTNRTHGEHFSTARPVVRPVAEAASGSASRPASRPISRNEDAASGPPTIRVTIGRIEVRAVHPPAPAPQKRAAASQPRISLEEYLRKRNGGSR